MDRIQIKVLEHHHASVLAYQHSEKLLVPLVLSPILLRRYDKYDYLHIR